MIQLQYTIPVRVVINQCSTINTSVATYPLFCEMQTLEMSSSSLWLSVFMWNGGVGMFQAYHVRSFKYQVFTIVRQYKRNISKAIYIYITLHRYMDIYDNDNVDLSTWPSVD